MLRTRESPPHPKSCTPRIKNTHFCTLHPCTPTRAPTPYTPTPGFMPLHLTAQNTNSCPYTLQSYTRTHAPTPYIPTPELRPLDLTTLHPNACPYTSHTYTRAHAPASYITSPPPHSSSQRERGRDITWKHNRVQSPILARRFSPKPSSPTTPLHYACRDALLLRIQGAGYGFQGVRYKV